MHLKRRGTVLISTMIILSLMSVLGCFMFKMMRNNLQIGSLYNFDKDRYDLDQKEEDILGKLMAEINLNIPVGEDGNIDTSNIFLEDFKKNIDGNILEYYKDDNRLFLKTHNEDETIRKREIYYITKKNKLILVPTYKFENKNE
jgi:hypothetical protein